MAKEKASGVATIALKKMRNNDCCGSGIKVDSLNKMPPKFAAKSSSEVHHHPDHSSKIKRINRISGQLDGVKRMIENGRYCPDILIQTRAVIAATKALEAAILKTHLEKCVASSFQSKDKSDISGKIAEILELFERF